MKNKWTQWGAVALVLIFGLFKMSQQDGSGSTRPDRETPTAVAERTGGRGQGEGMRLAGPYTVTGVAIVDINTGDTLPIDTVDLKPTLDRILAGVRDRHRNDGSVFQNRSHRLPRKPDGYYREFVVPTEGVSGPGPQRLVIGGEGEIYYTPDHYETFIRIEGDG